MHDVTGSAKTVVRQQTKYHIRWYEPNDEDDVVRLLRRQGETWDRERFERTYVDLPYLDHVPVILTETGGEVVGVHPFTACRIRSGDAVGLAMVPQNLLVHSEHRRRGLFTSMVEMGVERYAASKAVVMVCDPNENSAPAYRKFGWHVRGSPTKWLRIQHPDAVAKRLVGSEVAGLLRATARPLARGYFSLRDHLVRSADSASVTRYDGVPTARLEALYERRTPEVLHPVHDREFFEWRYATPQRQPNVTYVAEVDGRPAAGVVVQTDRSPCGLTMTFVRNCVPLTGSEAWLEGVRALLAAVVSDHPDSDVVRVAQPPFPPSLLRAHGFLPDDEPPLSAVRSEKLRVAMKPLEESGDWRDRLDERGLGELSDTFWSIKF